jgi:hypothetical protein
MKKITTIFLLLLNLTLLSASEKNEKSTNPDSKKKISFDFKSMNAAVGIHLGTAGIGLNYKTELIDRVFLRAGASYLPATYKMPITVSGLSTTANLAASFANVHLMGEYQVFEHIGLRLVGGFAYFVKGDLKATLLPKSAYTIENVTYTPADIGQLQLNIDWKGLAPYAGLGFGMPIPESKFNINMDLGLFYLSQPSTTVIGTARLQDNAAMATQINKNTADYRYYPVFQLSFNYKIN